LKKNLIDYEAFYSNHLIKCCCFQHLDVHNEVWGWNNLAGKPQVWRSTNEDARQSKDYDSGSSEGKL
jgi:hypothetical protein